jgi:tetratricopeptide (TPR) repeat protein
MHKFAAQKKTKPSYKINKMKRTFYSAITLLIGVALFATSCSSKLTPLKQSNFSVTPSPLETKGNDIPVTVSGTFPEKWFKKNAIVTITPVLRYGGNNEVKGLPYSYQGENIAGNRTVISNKNGGNFTMNFKLPFTEEMLASELYMTFDAKVKKKNAKLPDVKVADGVLATSTIASVNNTDPSVADDGFQRIIKEAKNANIHFLIQRADLRPSQVNNSDMRAWKDRVAKAFNDPKQNLNIEISAYASPDGGLSLNERLAEQREKNTSVYLEKELKSKNIDTEINARYTAEDWEGFSELIEQSDLPDKDLILRVLSMYPDAETREREIKNISLVYGEIAETILPQLRRSRITANIEIIGKSDAEIMDAWRTKPADLTVEELLYASTLTTDEKVQENIYQYATVHFPQDYRGWNNIGTMFYRNGNFEKARQSFMRAAQVAPNAPEVNMNQALLAIKDGNNDKAKELLGKSSGAAGLEGAMGLLYLMEGDYNKAVNAYGDSKTNNAALSQILTNDYAKATETLKSIQNPDATTAYLQAIVGARTNDFNSVLSSLRSAISQDGNLAKRALYDLEFYKYRTNNDFINLIR